MARGNGFADFSVVIPKATQADWSYPGDCWPSGFASSMIDEFNSPFLDAKKTTDLLSASWAATQTLSGPSHTSFEPCSSTQSDTLAGTESCGWKFESNLSALLQDKLSLSDSVNAEAASSTQSCKNHQFDSSELEWQTIGNLLPDVDDLFSSVAQDADGSLIASYSRENEELDLFISGGGLELENDPLDPSPGTKKSAEGSFGNGTASGVGEHPYGEHPSRTLFVRNINSSVEDAELRLLFEQFGDIRTLHTACKHRGFVMISYYDIRAARSAMRSLQNKALRRRKLDIHFSIPKDNPSDKDVNQGTLVVFNLDASVSNDELRQIFGVYGEVKEIRETPHKKHHKFIEYYDVRSAESALRALNKCDIAGKRIKLEPSRPGGARRSLMQHLSLDPQQDESYFLKDLTSPPLTKSAPVKVTMPGSFFLEKDPVHEAYQSLKQSGLGMYPQARLMRQTTFSEFGSNTEPANYSPSPVFSAISSKMLSDRLLKLGAPNFSNVSSLDSSHGGGLLTDSLLACSLEGLPANGFLCSSLNSFCHKESYSGYLPHSPAGLPYGVNGITSQGDIGLHNHPLGTAMLSPNHHHVGSAPITARPILGRHQAYSREPFVQSSTSGSLGTALRVGLRYSMEFPIASSLGNLAPGSLLSNGLADYNVSPASLSMTRQHKGNLSSKTMCDRLTAHSERMVDRGKSRKSDNVVSHHERKQYELDIHRIMRGEDIRTTLMIKNIPNKYTSKMLLAAIDEHHKSTYDFVYLPIDFKNKCNVGYAFINMTEPSKIVSFYQAFNGKRWEKFNSEKVASLAYARIQGKAALITHFQNSSLMNEDKRCRPILFHSGGPNVGDQEPFPIGTNPRTRLSKARGNHQGSSIVGYQ